MDYNHIEIEKKWQEYWDKNNIFECKVDSTKPKFYALDMFPYPSGAGLHVGHPEGYTATDIISRYKRMCGYNVIHPMGWDAFGLPAEQYAINTGNDPKDFTYKNISNFKRQIKSLGLSYDWNREIATCDPKYYKWTQWIFTKLYEKGLAEIKDIEVNWCEELGTVLANEEVLNKDGKMVSERGEYPVVKKPMKQWVLKITKYADRLLQDLDDLDWPENVKDMQRNWIGKSVGAEVNFSIKDSKETFTVFTTRCDTLFGVTYCILSPEHPLVKKITTKEQYNDVNKYIEYAKSKSDLERTDLNKDKTGCFTGSYAINPVNGKELPIWISDYVLNSYGTGAIMAVPAHDERDYAFAKKFDLPIIEVLKGDVDITKEAFVGDGVHINSGFLDGLNKQEAIDKMLEFLEEKKIGKKSINFKLRDWIFSRQRYWGEPFPVIIWEDGKIDVLPLEKLPLELPKMKKIELSKTGESPIANATDWVNVVREDGVKGRRETNTMPQWAGSSWYYIGYLLRNAKNDEYLDLSDPKVQDIVNYWLPVDLYIGGTEHAVLHLLYARFWHKVLYDCGVVKTKEPFQKLFNQGMILGTDGEKMSKSKGNVINPDDVVRDYGADTLRMYEMFMGPLDATKPWSTTGVEGPRRFLERVYRLYNDVAVIVEENKELEKIYHQTVMKVTDAYDTLRFNVAISQMMIFINECYRVKNVPLEYLDGFLKLLNPICPHITEELYSTILNKNESLVYSKWPKFDLNKTKDDLLTMMVSINGKTRDKIEVSHDATKEEIEKVALSSEKVKSFIESNSIKKIIVVPGKIVNIVM